MSHKIALALEQIANGQAIHWPTFIRALIKAGFNPPEVERILKPTASKGLTHVNITDHSEFKALRQRYPMKDLSTKATAALSGHSHNATNRASLLNISLPHSPYLTCATALNARDWVFPFGEEVFSRDAVIIENLENFLHTKKTRHFVAKILAKDTSEHIVLIWGVGKAAEKEEHLSLFQRFKRIHVLPDLDYEGLAIAARLAKKLRNFGEFIIPIDLERYLSISSRHMSPKESERLQKLAALEPRLSTAIAKLVRAGLTLEQEVYLLEPNEYGHT